MKELKPCPFCGSEAETRQDTSSDYEFHWDWSAQCKDDIHCGASIDCCATEKRAIEAWNERIE